MASLAQTLRGAENFMGNHTHPPSSSQEKIRCKQVETKMVDKYNLAEYIRSGFKLK